MRLIAIIFPALYFFLTLRILRGIVALLLMASVVGWVIASVWAISTYNDSQMRAMFARSAR